MLGNIGILLLLFVTGVLLAVGVGSVVLGLFRNRNRWVFVVRGVVLSVICLLLLGLIFYFTEPLALLQVSR
ncbi:MAG: hypothetical protein MUD08_04520 [Cytophagales bacterium]|jgi:hypothetical protein|nr:hypothetical protein [Cytophagales bacterium]